MSHVGKFLCPGCKQIIIRDMRVEKRNLTKRGYKSYCDKAMKTCICKPVK